MIRLAICDDSKYIVEQIEQYIENLEDTNIMYDVFFSAEELYNYITNHQVEFDIYILDIEMRQLSGIDVANMLRKEFPYALIIFLTSYPQYVYDVFEVVTFDFIIKPLSFERFSKVIKKAIKYLGLRKMCFQFNYRQNSYSIPYQTILYIEKAGRKAFIHTVSNDTYQCNLTIEEIWAKLDRRTFASTRKSCIVNLAAITEIVKDEIKLENGEIIFVGRQYKKDIQRSHMHFLKQEI